MADPKGPETGKGATGAPSARPRSPTLDLSATDVTQKPAATEKPSEAAAASSPAAAAAAASSASAQSKPADAPKPETARTEPPKPDASKATTPASALGGVPKPEPTKSEATKSEAPKPDVARPDVVKPDPAKTAAPPKPDAQKPTTAASASTPPKPAPSQSPAPEPSQGVGVLGLGVAALVGAAIAVAVVAAFGPQLIGPSDGSRVAAVEGKLDTVGRDVAALRSQVAKSAQAADTSAIDARLGEMAKSIEASGTKVQGVETEVKALAEQAANPVSDPALTVLAGRIDGVELRLQQAPSMDALKVLAGRVAGVETRTADLPSREQLGNLGQRIDAVGQKIESATAPLSTRVDKLAADFAAAPKGDPAARLVVALGALDRALEVGRPFAAELAAVTAAAGDNAELKPLDPYAASGVPTRATLGGRLADIIAKLDAPKAAQTASVLERFVANAGGIVKVTPQGGATGNDPAAVRQQVQAAAEKGDLEGALAARGKLDDAARAATEEWAALATARVSAENALNAARTAALARLTAND